MARTPELIGGRNAKPEQTTARQMFREAVGQFVTSGATCGFVSTAEIIPDGVIRDLGADGKPIEPTTLVLPANDRFKKMLPLGAPVSPDTDNPFGHWISSVIDSRVVTAMKNVNKHQVETYKSGDPRIPYLHTMNYWMFDTVKAKYPGDEMITSDVGSQEALVLLAASAYAHGVREGALGDMLMREMYSSHRRPDDEVRVARGLLHAAFVGLSTKDLGLEG